MPIDFSTVWDKREWFEGVQKPYIYTRTANPNRDAIGDQVSGINGFKNRATICSNSNAAHVTIAFYVKAEEEVIVINDDPAYE